MKIKKPLVLEAVLSLLIKNGRYIFILSCTLFVCPLLNNFHHSRIRRRKRKNWINPGRTSQWWDNLISDKTDPSDWKKNLRMSKQSFLTLVNLIRPFWVERSTTVRKDSIMLEKRVAITLHYLKDQGSMIMTANLFGIGRCTVGQVVYEICTIITNKLGPQFIQFPTEREDVLKAMAQFSNRFGFPQVVGCIDGTHIPIKEPVENAHDYVCYKFFPSLNVQAICDAYGRFINVEIKWPGSVHDAKAFAFSDVQKGYTEGKFSSFQKSLIPGDTEVPQLLIGDPAYPLLPYLMKEYDHCDSNEQVLFNQMLRSARNQIECAFGRLKARWRILLRNMDIPLHRLPPIIHACFVLHNFCEREKCEVDKEIVKKIIQHENAIIQKKDPIYTYSTGAGKNVRDAIKDYFKDC